MFADIQPLKEYNNESLVSKDVIASDDKNDNYDIN